MGRNFADWLTSYVEYASYTESPKRMHFFAGVSAIAGALRRHVWIDQRYFKWFPNQYIIFVAPPGVVNKSTTVALAMDVLRLVPGIGWGPDIMTWQALMSAFAESMESFPVGDDLYTQCALTMESGEFGILLDPQNRELVDFLVSLWDSKTGVMTKITKHVGSDKVENPFINLIACTTPSWIAGNFPDYLIGGGFTSRCLFVYADIKEKLVAYPSLHVPDNHDVVKQALAKDLEYIATHIMGPYTLSDAAIAWGEDWYARHHKEPPVDLRDDRFAGYLSRKQTHIHKLAMVLEASRGDSMVIGIDSLIDANQTISDLEIDMPKVFAKIGRSEESVQAERLLTFIRQHEAVDYAEAYRFIHQAFPNNRDFEGIIAGLTRAGLIRMQQVPGGYLLVPVDLVVTPPTV